VSEGAGTASADSWQIYQLQLVLFPIAPAVLAEQQWWRDLVQQEPEESTTKRHEKVTKGPVADGTLVLTVDLSKIAWALVPRVVSGELPLSLPILGRYSAVTTRFAELMRRWLAGRCPRIKRMGFVAAFLQTAPDHERAYRLL
jgi:hypothetical protein